MQICENLDHVLSFMITFSVFKFDAFMLRHNVFRFSLRTIEKKNHDSLMCDKWLATIELLIKHNNLYGVLRDSYIMNKGIKNSIAFVTLRIRACV